MKKIKRLSRKDKFILHLSSLQNKQHAKHKKILAGSPEFIDLMNKTSDEVALTLKEAVTTQLPPEEMAVVSSMSNEQKISKTKFIFRLCLLSLIGIFCWAWLSYTWPEYAAHLKVFMVFYTIIIICAITGEWIILK